MSTECSVQVRHETKYLKQERLWQGLEFQGGGMILLWVCCRKTEAAALAAVKAHGPKFLKSPGQCTV